MKNFYKHVLIVFLFSLMTNNLAAEGSKKLNIVTTLPDYAAFVKVLGQDRVLVKAIVKGKQDAHFIRPKPSFVNMVKQADVLIATGLDLELWLPTVINKSGNTKVRSGQKGFVSVSQGLPLLEKPKVLSRAEGGVHIYGNPHLTCSPLNMKTVIRNITIGLIKNDPQGREMYEKNMKSLLAEFDKHLFGERLIEILGSETLCSMAEKGNLISFLEKQEFQGKLLLDYLEGWLKQMLPLREIEIVTYHKNWIYFIKLFGLKEAGTVEPKPGIPPSPKHVTGLVELMRARNIKIILAANYFDEQKIRTVADRVGAEAVIVPLYVEGIKNIADYFQLVDYWIESLLAAASKKSILKRD